MPADDSQVLWFCPICGKPKKSETLVKNHITNSRDEAHKGLKGTTIDREIEWRSPVFEDYPFDEWAEEVENAVEKAATEGGIIPQFSEVTELVESAPNSYVLWWINQDEYKFENKRGLHTIHTSWDDLKEEGQHAILAVAYFSDLSYSDLAETNYAGYTTEDSIGRANRDYGWMLSHPEIETPVEPVEYQMHEGKVKSEGLDRDVDELVEEVNGEAVEEPDEAETTPSIEEEVPADTLDGRMQQIGERPELREREETVTVSLDLDRGNLLSLLRSDDKELAEEVFDQVVWSEIK